ncbi:MAG: type II toxin-antitoxin system HigB family toxin [bacterium]|nr:type II toxin-antitoxin system HigB family toxin [bacterium]
MRIIKTSMLREFWQSHRHAEASLRTWVRQTRAGQWRNFAQVRKTIPGADLVKVSSGRSVVVFNIAHNRYRLIAAVHYNTRIVYTLMILTHKEYDRNAWKEQL